MVLISVKDYERKSVNFYSNHFRPLLENDQASSRIIERTQLRLRISRSFTIIL